LQNSNYDWGMIAMAVEDDWVSVTKAAEIAGCSEQYIRRELLEHVEDDELRTTGGRLDGWRPNGKAWLVSRRSAAALAETLSTRARKHAAARSTSKAKRKS
jgi:DeoR/GlpR family transcriptional regulator of sugar metabolism